MKATKIRSALTRDGRCSLSIEDDRYVMDGPSGRHSLHAGSTDEARLVAHWEGFLANNGGTVRPVSTRWDEARARVVGPAYGRVPATALIGDWLFYDSGRPQNDRLVKIVSISARGKVYGRVFYRSGRWGSIRPVGSTRGR